MILGLNQGKLEGMRPGFIMCLWSDGEIVYCTNQLQVLPCPTTEQYEAFISSRTKRGLEELKKTKKLVSPQNLSQQARLKGLASVKLNKSENEN